MKNLLYLIKTIRKFGLKSVCNAASDLYPREKESAFEFSQRRKQYDRST